MKCVSEKISHVSEKFWRATRIINKCGGTGVSRAVRSVSLTHARAPYALSSKAISSNSISIVMVGVLSACGCAGYV